MAKNIISGYAAIWGVAYDMGSYEEIVSPNALDGVDFSECRLLFNHDSNKLLARTKSGTLTVKVDARGLFYRAELPDTETGREVATLLARGDIRESSWGFSLAASGKQWSSDGRTLTITKVSKLYDVSPVTYPANAHTTATLETPIFGDNVSKSSDFARYSDDAEFERRRQVMKEAERELIAARALKDLEMSRYLAGRGAKPFNANSPEELAKHDKRAIKMREALNSHF